MTRRGGGFVCAKFAGREGREECSGEFVVGVVDEAIVLSVSNDRESAAMRGGARDLCAGLVTLEGLSLIIVLGEVKGVKMIWRSPIENSHGTWEWQVCQ